MPELPQGRRVGGEPADEAEHFMVCLTCGQAFDMRDLAQVLHHQAAPHQPRPLDG